MSNDNGYYNNTGYPYGGGAPVPPPFPGAGVIAAANHTWMPHPAMAVNLITINRLVSSGSLHRHNKRCRRTTLWVLRVLCCHS